MLAHKLRRSVGGTGVSSLSFIASGSSTSHTITIPASAAEGDLVVVYQMAYRNSASAPTQVTPTGFTNAANGTWIISGIIGVRATIDYRVIGAGEAGTSITGMNGDLEDAKGIAVFRPDAPVVAVAAFSASFEGSASDPTSKTISTTGRTAPLVMLGHAFGGAVPTLTGTLVSSGTTFNGGSDQRCVYETQTVPANRTFDMNDTGTANTIQTVGLAVS